MDTDICGASVRENITFLITCVTKRRCFTHAEQECVSLYLRHTRLTNMNHCRLYSHTYTHTLKHVHTQIHTQTNRNGCLPGTVNIAYYTRAQDGIM